MNKPPFEETLPIDSDGGGKPPFEETMPVEVGGKAPWGMVASEVMKRTPWNQISSIFPKAAGAGAEQLGKMGVNPKVSAALMTPVAMAPELLGVISPAEDPVIGSKGAADYLTKSANQRWFKGLGGTLGQAKEIGPEEAQRLGRLARNERIITPLNSPESQLAGIQKYGDIGGQKIGEIRKLGDQIDAAPKHHEMLAEIQQELGPQYSSGMKSPQAGQFKNAMDELGSVQKMKRLPDEFSNESVPRSIFQKQEANPLFTDVPEKVTPQLNTAPPIVKDPRMLKLGMEPPAAASDFPGPYKNPMFLSGERNLTSSKSIPRNAFEDYRAAQEGGEIIPEYEVSKPGTSDIAGKITQMNRFAASQTKMLQPSNALTDVANAASAKNDAALVQAVGSTKGKEYVDSLQQFSDAEKMMKIIENKLAYETGASRNRIVNNLINRFEQRFGYPLSAEVLDRLANVAKPKPIFKGTNAAIAASSSILGKKPPIEENGKSVPVEAKKGPLNESKAREYLKAAGGDKEKARQKARDDGWDF